jgi:uncharacterized protein with FMN-binding domain
MRRILLVLLSTVAAVAALFGYRTSTPHPSTASSPAVAAGTPGGTSSVGGSTTTTPPAPKSTTAGSAPQATATKTITGRTAQTRWGPVQVRITVAGSRLTAVNVLQVPNGNGRDAEINSYAVPVLQEETLSAQSAGIDSVSGATVTSRGYIDSLQSALDQAGL